MGRLWKQRMKPERKAKCDVKSFRQPERNVRLGTTEETEALLAGPVHMKRRPVLDRANEAEMAKGTLPVRRLARQGVKRRHATSWWHR